MAARRRATKLGRDEDAGKLRLVQLAFFARGAVPDSETLQSLTTGNQQVVARLAGIVLPANDGAAANTAANIMHGAFQLAASSRSEESRALLGNRVETLRRRTQQEPTNARVWSQLAVVEALLADPKNNAPLF